MIARSAGSLCSLVASVLLLACGSRAATPEPDGGLAASDSGCSGAPTCDGDDAIVCRDGAPVRETCDACAPGLGCVTCAPGAGSCDGQTARACRSDGTGWDDVAVCDPAIGTVCDPLFGRCADLCADAAETRSYRGCEYWPVATTNGPLDRESFTFAVVVANPHEHAVTVSIDRGGEAIAEEAIAAGDSRAITLPWVPALQSDAASAIVAAGAYHLRSSLPVTAYQYNPLHYQVAGEHSFTNDASLLLPTTALGTQYVVVTRPSAAVQHDGSAISSRPGFVAIVATADETVIDVTSSSHVLASSDGRIAALAPGGSARLTLARGEVVQLVSAPPATCDGAGLEGTCDVPRDRDLTGTEVRASHPIAVIAGHDCANVAYDRPSCDHLEESLFPVTAWGDSAIVAPSQPLRDEPHFVRIVSATDDNALVFDPASTHAAVTLDRGDVLELETRAAFVVRGSDALQVAQFMVGQDYAFPGDGGQGDPSMSIVVPIEQFRTEYQVLTTGTYATDALNVIAPAGAAVMVDGIGVAGFAPIGESGYGLARVPLTTAGAHRVTGDVAFGVVAYGFAEYTSYMMPGGLDLRAINEPF